MICATLEGAQRGCGADWEITRFTGHWAGIPPEAVWLAKSHVGSFGSEAETRQALPDNGPYFNAYGGCWEGAGQGKCRW